MTVLSPLAASLADGIPSARRDWLTVFFLSYLYDK
jgi:hypothetical protein